jgi:hypothetical protein
MWVTGPYVKSWCIRPALEATMHPTITAAIAKQRHADLIAEAEQIRRARAHRATRSKQTRRSTRSSRLLSVVSRRIGPFSHWLAGGQL